VVRAGSPGKYAGVFVSSRPQPQSILVPLSPSLWTTVTGQPEGAGSGNAQTARGGKAVARDTGSSLSNGPVASMDRHARSWCENAAPLGLHTPPVSQAPPRRLPAVRHGFTRSSTMTTDLWPDATAIGSGYSPGEATIGRASILG
jgi:hypothetical protein